MRIRYVLLFIISLPLFFIVSSANSQTDEWTIPYTAIGRGAIESVAWYPDNERIFVSTANDVWIYGLDLEIIAHLPNVGFARLSPNGWYIAGVDGSNELRVWDASTLDNVAVLLESEPFVDHRAIEWSPNSHYIAHAGRCHYDCVEVWSADSFESVDYFLGEADSISWSPSSDSLALYQHATRSVVVVKPGDPSRTQADQIDWEDPPPSAAGFRFTNSEGVFNIYAENGQYSVMSGLRLEHMGVSALEWSTDGRQLALGTWDHDFSAHAEVVLFDPVADHITARLEGLREAINHIRWSADDRYILASDEQQQIALYDTYSAMLVAQSSAHTLVGSTAAWRPHSDQIAVADSVSSWALWDATTGQSLFAPAERTLHFPITSIDWNTNGKLFFASGTAHPFVILEPKKGLIFDVEQVNDDPFPQLTAYFSSFQTEPDELLQNLQWRPYHDEIVAYIGTPDDEHSIIWNTVTDTLQETVPLHVRSDLIHAFDYMMISPSGQYVALILQGYGIYVSYIHDLETGAAILVNVHSNQSALRWSQDDSLIDLSWFVHSHDHFGRFDADIRAASPINATQPSSDPEAAGSRQLFNWKIRGFTSLVTVGFLSPFGRYAAVLDATHQGTVTLSETGEPLFFLANAANVVWSPDETRLIVQRTDGAIWLMEADGTILAELDRPRSFNRAGGEFVWSPEGDRLALVNAGHVLVWEILN